MTFLSRGFKNLQWYGMTEGIPVISRVHVHRYTMWPMGQTGRYRARKNKSGEIPSIYFFFDPKFIWAIHFNWMRRLDMGYNIRWNFSPLPFHWQRAVFCLTVIEHPLIALQHCISLRCHTSCKESATPAEEIPELSAGQAEWWIDTQRTRTYCPAFFLQEVPPPATE